MKSSRSDLTPSLFDDVPAAAQTAPAETVETVDDELDEWTDVPQARFLSWSHAMQLHYCWRRDLDSSIRADNDNDATFFLQRAASYKQMFDELNTHE